jgi:hypothetical protein
VSGRAPFDAIDEDKDGRISPDEYREFQAFKIEAPGLAGEAEGEERQEVIQLYTRILAFEGMPHALLNTKAFLFIE